MTDRITDGVAAIWAKLLGVKSVAGGDNFFAIGGHSLMAVKLVGEVQQKLHIGSVQLSDLFENPTLDAFSARLKELAAEEEGGEL